MLSGIGIYLQCFVEQFRCSNVMIAALRQLALYLSRGVMHQLHQVCSMGFQNETRNSSAANKKGPPVIQGCHFN